MNQGPPKLVVGLGNPGPDYAETRHNAGFWFCDALAEMLGARFAAESRFHGLVASARESGIYLLKPMTFMNRSGLAVAVLARYFKVPPDEILVVHDELDLPPGALRLKYGGGTGGHNGLKDISAHCGTANYWRLRIGIGHPGDRQEVVNYVLKPPRLEEVRAIDDAIDRALTLWPWIARGEWAAATQRVNTRPPPAPQHESKTK
ncbi:MAG: aminoacyl-tRNA hydrolase [Zoogloeaceae bacterium]|nr:aminoacyl-tRNA hydrolase [Zoogloeaceae bacterium]